MLTLDDGERAVIYPSSELGNAAIHDSFAGQGLVIFSSHDGAWVTGETSSRWNLGGRAIDGPLAGSQLTVLPSRSAFWFSIRAAFETIDVVRE